MPAFLQKHFWKIILPLIGIFTLFITASILTQRYEAHSIAFVHRGGFWGVALYIFVDILSTVIVPLTNIPLIPVAAAAWGVLATTILNIVGWTTGAFIAFGISRKYGVPFIERAASEETVEKIRVLVPRENLFWFLVFLRMILPVDITSYALGLLRRINWRLFLATTIIGVMPFAFILSYAGTLSIIYQIVLFSAGIPIIAWLVYLRWRSIKV